MLSKKNILKLGGAILLFICLLIFFIKDRVTVNEKEEQLTPITLELVYAYQNAQWSQGIENIVEAFEKEYEHIKINTQVQYEDKVYEDILYKLQARGELGDIVQLKTPRRYAKEGLLSPIDTSIGKLVEESSIYGDSIYGVQAIGSTSGIIYNRDIFEALKLAEPSDYHEFLASCEALRKDGITPIGVAGGDLWHMEFWVNHFFRTDVIAKNEDWLLRRIQGNVSWTDEEPVRMLTHLKQLFTSEYVNEDWAVMRDQNLAYSMSQGEVAMMYSGSWTVKEIKKLNPDMNLGWFYVPDEDGTRVITQNSDVFWSLTTACGQEEEKYQAALCFLEFYYSDEAYSALCQEMYGFPVTVDRAEYEETRMQLEIKNKFNTQDNHISSYIGNEETPQGFEKSMLYELQSLMGGKTDVQQTAEKLEELWDYYQKQEK